MTPDELRALADALPEGVHWSDPITPDMLAEAIKRFCADAQPVAWRCEVRGDGTRPALGASDWRHYATTTNERTAQAFLSRCGDGIEGRVVPLTAAPAAPQAEPKREPLSDERITNGEYVLATKWGDGDPGDHWGVGFYDRLENGRHYIVDRAGKQIRGNGFRRAGRITADVGRWLLSAAKSLEAAPPGTVNLWTMLTERAYGIGGSDAE